MPFARRSSSGVLPGEHRWQAVGWRIAARLPVSSMQVPCAAASLVAAATRAPGWGARSWQGGDSGPGWWGRSAPSTGWGPRGATCPRV